MERADTPRTTVPRPRALLGALAALALALAAIVGPAAAQPQPPGAGKAADPARTATVMTRNLYLGSSLDAIVAALPSGDQELILKAATETWQTVVDSHPEERMAAIADEIVAAKPHAVGLQEVTRWTTYDYNPANDTTSNAAVAYDFLELLLAELAERGVTYREVPGATATNFTTQRPIPIMPGNRAVSLQDRDVIIVRDDVKAKHARNGNFETILKPPAFAIEVARGWGSADLKVQEGRPAHFRFVNSHTEAFGPEAIRIGEVLELLAAQAAIADQYGPLPTVYAGDFNTPATSGGAYQTLISGGLHDLWTEANAGATAAEGATCCQDADLRNEVSALDTRIDLLLGTAGVRALSAERIGDEPVDLPDGVQWASDHAGVVADVVIPRP